jgi:hypothetical protein
MENCGHKCKPLCKGLKLVFLGVVLIVNEIYQKVNPWFLLGSLLILAGLVKAVVGGCMCHKMSGCSCCTEEKKDEKQKKRHH